MWFTILCIIPAAAWPHHDSVRVSFPTAASYSSTLAFAAAGLANALLGCGWSVVAATAAPAAGWGSLGALGWVLLLVTRRPESVWLIQALGIVGQVAACLVNFGLMVRDFASAQVGAPCLPA